MARATNSSTVITMSMRDVDRIERNHPVPRARVITAALIEPPRDVARTPGCARGAVQ